MEDLKKSHPTSQTFAFFKIKLKKEKTVQGNSGIIMKFHINMC